MRIETKTSMRSGEKLYQLGYPSLVENVLVGSSLIDFYGKCKLIGNARKVLDEMPRNNVVSWTCMVLGYVNFGDLVNACKVFDAMHKRDRVSCNAMISGYVKFGYLDAARKLFVEFPLKNVVTYTTMIDGSVCQLNAAYDRLNSLPIEAHAEALGALLGACGLHSDFELAQVVANRIGELEPHNAGKSVLLSNVYAAADRWLDVSLVRNQMVDRGLKRIPDHCWF